MLNLFKIIILKLRKKTGYLYTEEHIPRVSMLEGVVKTITRGFGGNYGI